VTARRITRIRPSLAVLFERVEEHEPPEVALGDLAAGRAITLLLELIVPPRPARGAPLASVALTADGAPPIGATIRAAPQPGRPPMDPALRDAAARASVARLQRRAAEQSAQPAEAARLLRAAASQLDALGEHALARIARDQAAAAERTGRLPALATKELTYATRRLGGEG
jgi:hypothetical protein